MAARQANIHRHSLSLFPLNPSEIYQPNVTTSENLYAICIIPGCSSEIPRKQQQQPGSAQWHLPVADVEQDRAGQSRAGFAYAFPLPASSFAACELVNCALEIPLTVTELNTVTPPTLPTLLVSE